MQSSIFERARPLITRSYIENQFSAPGSHWKGNSFWTLNPTRDDSEIGSFSIREDGKWFDHATYTGGDVFDLISIRDSLPAADVARELVGERDDGDPTTRLQRTPSGSASRRRRLSARSSFPTGSQSRKTAHRTSKYSRITSRSFSTTTS